MLTRTLFLKMADSAAMRSMVETRGWRFAQRFVAGPTLDDAVKVVHQLKTQGISATLSHLGEHVTDVGLAEAEADILASTLERAHVEGLNCGVSVKPSQIGLMVDPALAERGLAGILERAGGQFVRVDMEGSQTTDATLQLVRNMRKDHANVGVVIQAYLYRSRADVNALIDEGISVRLCKGAYNEPPEIAFASKRQVDENYHLLMKMLLHSGHHPAIATHDERLIRSTIYVADEELPQIAKVAPRRNTDHHNWEFQMLYGVRRDLQTKLAEAGYGMRVYVPYGTEWYPYFMRRLAERPANIAFILKNLRRR